MDRKLMVGRNVSRGTVVPNGRFTDRAKLGPARARRVLGLSGLGVMVRVSAAATALVLPAALACAQSGTIANPVYVDDAPTAADAQVRVRELASAGNLDEAARVLQALLDDHADRVVASPNDADLFVSVRHRVHDMLRANAPLLARYRALFSPRAEAELQAGHDAVVERSFLLTPSGFDAALRIAQKQLEDAQFEAARLTLLQLNGHPDEASEKVKPCAAIWAQLLRYLDRDDVRRSAEAWRARAGQKSAPVQAVEWPASATGRSRSAIEPAPELITDGLVSKPLWTVDHGSISRGRDQAGGGGGGRGQRGNPSNVSAFLRDLFILPAVAGDLVLTNDGVIVSAWDRFTLASRWSARFTETEPAVGDDVRARIGRMQNYGWNNSPRADDAASVSVYGPYVVVSTGRGVGGRDGDDRLSGLELSTGRLRWTTELPRLDPSLADCAVRGPVEIVENTAVVAVRKQARERRLVGLTLLGLDARTGAAQWVRTIASTGSMPWIDQTAGSEAMLAVEGMVYRSDRLGAMCALEAATGRVKWIRRMPVDPATQTEPTTPWQIARPIGEGESILNLSPDGRRVIRIERDTGVVLGERKLAEAGEPTPRYLLKAAGRLVVVCEDRLRILDPGQLEAGPIVTTARIEDPGIWGRVIASGDHVLVPVTTTAGRGLQIVDPRSPDAPKVQPLDELGNVLALDSQLIVVDDSRLHSYLKWDTAEALLNKRVVDEPKNPTAAVTLVELAFRAAKSDRIVGVVTGAMEALSRAGEGGASERERLFGVVHDIVMRSVEPELRQSTPGAVTDPVALSALVARMSELATTSEHRLAQSLAAGRTRELAAQPAEAAEQYQRILSTPALATSTWSGPGMTVRGDLEATRRLEMLIRAGGAGVYAGPDAQAQAKLAALGPSPSSDALAQLATEYPFAGQTSGLFLKIAIQQLEKSQTSAAIVSLESGLRGALRTGVSDTSVVSELGGRLVNELRRRGQSAAATALVKGIHARFPTIALTSAGTTLNVENVLAELAERVATGQRWPRVGHAVPENIQTLAGWVLVEPLLRDAGPLTAPGLVLASDEEIALWTTPAVGASGTSDGQLVRSWGMKTVGHEVRLVKMTGDAAIFLELGEGKGSVVKASIGKTSPAWTTEVVAKAFGNEESRGLRRVAGVMDDRFDTPIERQVSPVDLLVAMDDRTLVLAQRGGKVAAVDTDSGELLWAARPGIGRVYDCDLAGGSLVLVGAEEITGPNGAVIELRPTAQVVDARSGRPLQRLSEIKGQTHWVKIAHNGSVIIGSDSAVACYDMNTGQTNWVLMGQEAMPIVAAWAMNDHLVMLNSERALMLASISAGRMQSTSLEVPKTLLDGTRLIEVYPLGAGTSPGFAVSTQQGVAFFSGDGSLTGADGLNGTTTLVPPRPAEDHSVAIETIADGRAGEGQLFFSLLGLDVPTGMMQTKRTVTLGARPTDLTLLDGRIAISAGGATVILRAPVQPGGAPDDVKP